MKQNHSNAKETPNKTSPCLQNHHFSQKTIIQHLKSSTPAMKLVGLAMRTMCLFSCGRRKEETRQRVVQGQTTSLLAFCSAQCISAFLSSFLCLVFIVFVCFLSLFLLNPSCLMEHSPHAKRHVSQVLSSEIRQDHQSVFEPSRAMETH